MYATPRTGMSTFLLSAVSIHKVHYFLFRLFSVLFELYTLVIVPEIIWVASESELLSFFRWFVNKKNQMPFVFLIVIRQEIVLTHHQMSAGLINLIDTHWLEIPNFSSILRLVKYILSIVISHVYNFMFYLYMLCRSATRLDVDYNAFQQWFEISLH